MYRLMMQRRIQYTSVTHYILHVILDIYTLRQRADTRSSKHKFHLFVEWYKCFSTSFLSALYFYWTLRVPSNLYRMHKQYLDHFLIPRLILPCYIWVIFEYQSDTIFLEPRTPKMNSFIKSHLSNPIREFYHLKSINVVINKMIVIKIYV